MQWHLLQLIFRCLPMLLRDRQGPSMEWQQPMNQGLTLLSLGFQSVVILQARLEPAHKCVTPPPSAHVLHKFARSPLQCCTTTGECPGPDIRRIFPRPSSPCRIEGAPGKLPELVQFPDCICLHVTRPQIYEWPHVAQRPWTCNDGPGLSNQEPMLSVKAGAQSRRRRSGRWWS